ncbi:lysophospholipid acyltransferase family protein [Fluviispira multicolorata]|uniref:1-acyl-sn-glycerol-3-phosphate acyltransferase n=1 Tax=Fluviispira multicolorata TaxID=2654512 RepID=A0A833N5H2_9BACT|nr:lysophospholipid acyltransferase family protein [Fluviispira multicolorata]KAB8027781.1 1-acylglycerol-3-phosphate O-acyltransferase [Fluviispira multicolorata]
MSISQKINEEIRERDFKNLFRGVFTWINVTVFTVFYSSLILIFFPFVYLIDRERHSLHFLANLWAKSIKIANPWWQFEVIGTENLAKKGEAVVYVANHQSQADILALFIISTRFRWLAKESLFKVPFFGWGMRAVGYVPVNRTSKSSGEKSMKLSSRHLRRGTPMVFFPEGTRSEDGRLKEFKSGAFRLAKAMHVPVVPITLNGCANLLPKGSLLPKLAKVTITIHPKIQTAEITANEVMQKARESISSKL